MNKQIAGKYFLFTVQEFETIKVFMISSLFARIIIMKIKFWGVRGSLPSCGPAFLKYGGHTSCVELRSKSGELIVIDAGTGIKDLGRSIIGNCPESFTMLFSHSHSDHIFGFPFFLPIYKKGVKINMYGCDYSSGPVREIVLRFMQPPFFPVKFENISAKFEFNLLAKGVTEISGIKIKLIEISHPDGGFGFRFEEDGKSIVFLTDNELMFRHKGGHSFEEYADFCKNADILIHDAQYTENDYKTHISWGHSTPEQVIELAKKAGVKKAVFFHHDPERTDAELDRMTAFAHNMIRKSGYKISCDAARADQEIIL